MEPIIALLILVFLIAPFCVGIWLIVRAVVSQNKIEELSRRMDQLQLELLKLKRSTPAATQTNEEKVSRSAPAPPPPRSAEAMATQPPPIPTQEAHTVPEYQPEIPPAPQPAPATPIPPPLSEPAVPELFATSMANRPAAQPIPLAAKATATPPPIVPPPFKPKHIPPPVPPLEPALETAEASTMPSAPEKSSIEMWLGTYLSGRVGVVIVLAGLALGANLAYPYIVSKLGPGAKISLLYLASGLLLGAGAWWQRRNVKESLKNYAQVLFAGGLAAVYFTTFAAHYVPPVCVIPNPLLDGTLLFVWAGVIAWIADRRKSEVMALFAVGLAFFTSVITRVGEFTLYSNLILTIAAVVFLVRNRWAGLSFAALITSYAGYAFWRFLHTDGWRWATPDENLWLGAGFLACYWLVFTAATFLSKSEKLSGPNRAAFLTLNNGAYFALFVLTMLQVRTGGFWIFSLIYGVVLLAAAALAKRLLPAEQLTKNSYLTHGLVLVTLGFISKFAGLKLAMVLGAESVVLYVLGTQRQSDVLKFFAYAAAVLATGWCAATFKYFDPQDLWMGAGLGVLLAFNSGWAHRLETRANPESNRLESSAFALLAFASWALATWFNTPEPHLPVALVLGVESMVFYTLIYGQKMPAPKIVAYASAICAVVWCLVTLKRFDTTGLLAGITIGLIMVFNALRAHLSQSQQSINPSIQPSGNSQPLRAEPTAFTVLALIGWLATTWFNTTGAHLPLVLAAEALVLTFSIYVLRVPEITFLGQFFLIFAQVAWLLHYLNVTPPWRNPLLIIAVTIGLSHWWQHQKILTISRNIFVCYSAIFALASIAVVLEWLHPLVSAPAWLAVTSLLAVAVTGYGLVTRIWALAVCGQIFLAVSAWEFLQQLFNEKPEWYFPLAPLAVLAALSFATMAWFVRKPDSRSEVHEPLLQVAMVYRWLALAMSLLWVWDYVPERQRVCAFMLAAAVVFALGIWRNSREALVATAAYAVASLALLWLRDDLAMDVYWPNLLSLLALFVMQQVLRRVAAILPLDESIHGAVVVVAGLSLWRFLSCWTALSVSGFAVTMSWAGFALVMFTAGMLLHERFLRWFGLGVLATAVGRVVFVDLWNEAPAYRVLTIIALGMALLVVGFIYNKYQEKIRQWL